MNRFLAISLVLAFVLAPSIVAAQDKAEGDLEKMRARVQEHQDLGVAVHRPDGWIFGQPEEGVAAMLRAAGDSQSQIEVRVSKHVKKKQRNVFFTSFHANIKRAGFDVVEQREGADYGGKQGTETEYETGGDDKAYRLVVWQHHRGDRAFLVVGFFPKEARAIQHKDFQVVCEKLQIK